MLSAKYFAPRTYTQTQKGVIRSKRCGLPFLSWFLHSSLTWTKHTYSSQQTSILSLHLLHYYIHDTKYLLNQLHLYLLVVTPNHKIFWKYSPLWQNRTGTLLQNTIPQCSHVIFGLFKQIWNVTSNFSLFMLLLTLFRFLSRFGLTAYGEPCTDPCSQKGFPYAWCHKKASHNGTWIDRDYCSPGPGLTRYLEPCLTSCQVSLEKVASQLVWSGFADMIGPKR